MRFTNNLKTYSETGFWSALKPGHGEIDKSSRDTTFFTATSGGGLLRSSTQWFSLKKGGGGFNAQCILKG